MNLQNLYTLKGICKNLLKKEQNPDFKKSLNELLLASEGEIETIEHPPHAPNINSLPVQIVNKNRDGSLATAIDYGQMTDAPPDLDIDNYNTLNQWVTVWMHWLRVNATLLNEDFSSEQKHEAYDMEKFTRPVARPDLVAILGSGPSLEKNAPFLKDFPGFRSRSVGEGNDRRVCIFRETEQDKMLEEAPDDEPDFVPQQDNPGHKLNASL